MNPVAAAARLAGRRGRVLLHSGRDDDGCGRWSFVACEPIRSIEAWGRAIVVRDAAGDVEQRYDGDPFDALDRYARSEQTSGEWPVPRAIGYLGYDLGRTIEALGPGPNLGDDVPDMWFGIYDAVWCHDRLTGRTCVAAESDRAGAALRQALDDGVAAPGRTPEFGALRDDAHREAYERSVERIRDYIRAGDVYQANLARRLVAPIVTDGDALGLYCALLRSSPAAFGAVIEADGARIVSGSPERFLARDPGSDRLETRPIKGTRRRTGNAIRDAKIATELAIDEKECAEHLMIVDLERNDLGRVAQTGSVRVDGLGYLVELPTLYHLVSTVSCRVRDGVSAADILRATFPGGSITGAPKIRAMQIIDELEVARRGPYTGAVGYLGRGGAMDLSIVIRAAVLASGELRLHVGGGIVADSTPAREYEETEEKAAAWRAALAAVTEGGDDETIVSAGSTDDIDGDRGAGRRTAG